MPRHVNKPQHRIIIQVMISKPQINCQTTAFFFWQAVRINPGQSLDE